jgi:hypothetical protein
MRVGNCKAYDLSGLDKAQLGNGRGNASTSISTGISTGSGVVEDNISNGAPYVVGSGKLFNWGKRLVTFGRKHLSPVARMLATAGKDAAKNIATDIVANHGSDIANEAAAALAGAAGRNKVNSKVTGLVTGAIGAAGKSAQAKAKASKADLNIGETLISDRSKSLLKDLIASRSEKRAGITKGNGTQLLGNGSTTISGGAANSFNSTVVN